MGRSGWSQNPQAQADPSTESPTPGPSSPNASGVGTPESNRKRQTRGGGDDDDMDSDDLDDDASNKRTKVDSGTGTGATTPVNGDQVQLKGVGEFMNCSECGTQFTVVSCERRNFISILCKLTFDLITIGRPLTPKVTLQSQDTCAMNVLLSLGSTLWQKPRKSLSGKGHLLQGINGTRLWLMRRSRVCCLWETCV